MRKSVQGCCAYSCSRRHEDVTAASGGFQTDEERDQLIKTLTPNHIFHCCNQTRPSLLCALAADLLSAGLKTVIFPLGWQSLPVFSRGDVSALLRDHTVLITACLGLYCFLFIWVRVIIWLSSTEHWRRIMTAFHLFFFKYLKSHMYLHFPNKREQLCVNN